MAKKALLSKLNLKDYNNELEEILEKKNFSSQAKNLLLSMFYKLDVGYKDYAIVKKDVISKENLMKGLMYIIGQKCREIEIIKPNDENFETNKYIINIKSGKISCVQNEFTMLSAILNIWEKEFPIQEKYNEIKPSIQKILSFGFELT